MRPKLHLLGCVFSLIITWSMPLYAGGGHEHDEHHQEAEEAKGPNGGMLLTSDGFALEITIFETGIPPEMRVFAYYQGEAIAPEQIQLNVSLERLGGISDKLSFKTEQNYLVSQQVITEPHSYDVAIDANFQGKSYEWHYESHEGRTDIAERFLKRSNIKTAHVGPRTLNLTDTLFGVIAVPEDQIFRLFAPFPSMVEKVHVKVGDSVKKGQTLLTLRNINTQQRYTLKSPSQGEITERWVNTGDRANDKALLQLADFSEVWVEMSAFPESIENIKNGQSVKVYDMHQHEQAAGKITYVSPQMTGGHIARARAVIANPDGHWRPGMHVKADIQLQQHHAELAIDKRALQSFREMPVVFARYGNTFEVRMVELGKSDGNYIEVLGGIAPNTEYVTENSFLLKADVLKDGASHDH